MQKADIGTNISLLKLLQKMNIITNIECTTGAGDTQRKVAAISFQHTPLLLAGHIVADYAH